MRGSLASRLWTSPGDTLDRYSRIPPFWGRGDLGGLPFPLFPMLHVCFRFLLFSFGCERHGRGEGKEKQEGSGEGKDPTDRSAPTCSLSPEDLSLSFRVSPPSPLGQQTFSLRRSPPQVPCHWPRVFLLFFFVVFFAFIGNDPAAGSPTATLLRLLLPLARGHWPDSERS